MKKHIILGLFILTLGLVGCEGKSNNQETNNLENNEEVKLVEDQEEQEPLRVVEQKEIQQLAFDILRYDKVIMENAVFSLDTEEEFRDVEYKMSVIESNLSEYDNDDLLNSNEDLKMVYGSGRNIYNFEKHYVKEKELYVENLNNGYIGSSCINENVHSKLHAAHADSKAYLTELLKTYDESFNGISKDDIKDL